MRLPLDRLRHAALLELLARFDELGCRAVLIFRDVDDGFLRQVQEGFDACLAPDSKPSASV